MFKTEYQAKKNKHLPHLLFALSQGSKAAKAARDIFVVYGESAIAIVIGMPS